MTDNKPEQTIEDNIISQGFQNLVIQLEHDCGKVAKYTIDALREIIEEL